MIIKRLKLGSRVLDPEEPPNQSTQIRQLALRCMEGYPCNSDVALLALNVALLVCVRHLISNQNLVYFFYSTSLHSL
jgi:hypothetical protein